jgi:hypothetical protein
LKNVFNLNNTIPHSVRLVDPISGLETKQNKVLEAMADAHQAGISAILGSTSPFVTQVAGAAVPTHSKDILLKPAQVTALKLQGILKAGKKT